MSEQIRLTHLLGSGLTSPAWFDSMYPLWAPGFRRCQFRELMRVPIPLPKGALDLLCFDLTP